MLRPITMIIPKSILEPFGYIGIPHLDPVLAKVETIDFALRQTVLTLDTIPLSPKSIAVLRRTVVLAGAHIIHPVHTRVMPDSKVIFKVIFTLKPHGKEYCSYPSYYPQ